MNTERNTEMDFSLFYTELETLMKKMEYETARLKVDDPDISEMLRTMMPVDAAGNRILLEVIAVEYNEHTFMIQIYTTLLMEIGPGLEALKEKLTNWNLTCPIGAFGIYTGENQLYHKYNYLMPSDEDLKDMAAEIFYIIHLIMEVITDIYAEAAEISAGS